MAVLSKMIEGEGQKHLHLFNTSDGLLSMEKSEEQHFLEEVVTAPVFSLMAQIALCSRIQSEYPNQQFGNELVFPQYGLLGKDLSDDQANNEENPNLIYSNASAPWSAFICGSQGSGKSHTLSCLLENSLLKNSLVPGRLTSPLSAVIMHYDKFTSFASTQLCEAAFLCSSIPVRVMVSPTNAMAMRDAYRQMLGNPAGNRLQVIPLYLPKDGLTTTMMKALMGLNSKDGKPLYMEMIMKILREMAIENQGREAFDYDKFRTRVDKVTWVKGQETALLMRLGVLESFFRPISLQRSHSRPSASNLDSWKFEPGTLTIIDLSCPFVDADDACALFNICVSLFLKDRNSAGRILALDEAHKFLGASSPEASGLTDTLLSIVRQQRHLATRVVIATQEPTVAPEFLDLCNLTMIHRFTSPNWFATIKNHLAGASDQSKAGKEAAQELFNCIVELKTGQAILFCPTGLFAAKKVEPRALDEENGDWKKIEDDGTCGKTDSGRGTPTEGKTGVASGSGEGPLGGQVVRLGPRFLHVQVRNRITVDGGRSIMTQ